MLFHDLASYTDLATRLTLEDALTLIEYHQVASYNKQLLDELKNELSNS